MNPDSNTDFHQELWDYINTLEQTNIELVDGIKNCVNLLEQIEHAPSPPASWQEIHALFCHTGMASEEAFAKNPADI